MPFSVTGHIHHHGPSQRISICYRRDTRYFKFVFATDTEMAVESYFLVTAFVLCNGMRTTETRTSEGSTYTDNWRTTTPYLRFRSFLRLQASS